MAGYRFSVGNKGSTLFIWQRYGIPVIAGVMLLLPLSVAARVSGPCADCHTMHNSQNGVSMVVDGGGPNRGLLRDSCGGCHQGSNTGGGKPYVWDDGEPIYGDTGTEVNTNTLAGGSFYWVANGLGAGDAAGHNVEGVAAQDDRLYNTPPGGADLGGRLNCAGTRGCHGNRAVSDEYQDMLGAHHGEEDAGWKDGSTLANSYRFLSGVKGLEDSDYEYQPDAAHHSKYFGIDRSSDGDVSGTVSALCGDCHNDFHNGSGEIAVGSFGVSRVWLRHPTDFDMNRVVQNSDSSYTEFATYNGGTAGTPATYSVVAPVATADTSNVLNQTVFATVDDAIIMCLSCHRPHGSKFKSSLRWDYQSWPQSGYNGCQICHTLKD